MTKCRRVCCDTRKRSFMPEDAAEAVVLSVEELESLRLCDLEGADQSAAALSMGVSRGTLQRIVYSARRKVAEALCFGKGICISGGNYRLAERKCGSGARCSRCRFVQAGDDLETDKCHNDERKRSSMMKDGVIAVTADNGEIFQHFGHTRWFEVYRIKDGAVVSHETIDAEGSGHSALGGFLLDHGVGLLICGGIGGGAKNVLAAAGIELISGVSGSVDEAVKLYLEGGLKDDPSAECSHHHHGHEVEGSCRGCGEGHEHSCH